MNINKVLFLILSWLGVLACFLGLYFSEYLPKEFPFIKLRNEEYGLVLTLYWLAMASIATYSISFSKKIGKIADIAIGSLITIGIILIYSFNVMVGIAVFWLCICFYEPNS